MKKKFDDQNFKTFCLLVAIYDALKNDFRRFSESWQLTKEEKKNYHMADGALTRIVESITNRLDKKYLSEIIPVLKNLDIKVRNKKDSEITLRIMSNAWEHSCKNCTLCNWKACQTRKDYLEFGVPTFDQGTGQCPYKYIEVKEG